MLQRIQSIWLLLAATMSALSLKFSFFSGNKLNPETNVKEWIEYTAAQGSLNAIVQRPKKATVDQLIDIGYILVEYFFILQCKQNLY